MANPRRNVLLIDSTGRGHALADLFQRTDPSVEVFYGPGNSAVAHERIHTVPEVLLGDPASAVRFCQARAIDFVFVSHIDALSTGYVDFLKTSGIPTIGPDRAAARLETSKAFTKSLLKRYGVNTARFEVFDRPEPAKRYIRRLDYDVVVKADGLCEGNGAYVCDDQASALQAVDTIMLTRAHKDAGNRIIVEERLFGLEISIFALFDGKDFLICPAALDYKRSNDGNKGVNCDGMGSLSPHPLADKALYREIGTEILEPLRAAILGEGLNYNGFIYVGAMLCHDGIKVIEINARFGDSEAQVVLPKVQTNFVRLCEGVLQGTLGSLSIETDNKCYCNVVAGQGATIRLDKDGSEIRYRGWPHGDFEVGFPISGLDSLDRRNCHLFFANVHRDAEDCLVTSGGRVLHVTGVGDNCAQAVHHAYTNIEKIRFAGMSYRSDIGVIYEPVMRCGRESEILPRHWMWQMPCESDATRPGAASSTPVHANAYPTLVQQ
ncbi:phosphoribosylamine--glycine ligase [Sinorhizobium mexicanum]|nr:phosphoribosylamine--glycine ligase [Sinorhizobium mexicanum]MBP1888335.1 phosphoribosylamine--glycine ligase [Sinorhizobium mexicanum]